MNNMKILKFLGSTFVLSSLLFGCLSDKQLAEKMKKAMKEDPSILTEAVKENPAEFIQALQKAAEDARGELAKKRQEEEEKRFNNSFDQPLQPVIRKDETIRGTRGAPLVLIEYSDFECPFCKRGFETVQSLLKKYKGKIQFVYKHLPLNFHKNAMLASQYYEAIRLQSEEKAFKFHDEIYLNQTKLKKGEKFLKPIAQKLKVNMTKLKKDIKSKKVNDRIAEDQKEAAKFGISGTPGFILNGVPVRGAYPVDHFERIIAKLKEKGKVKL